MLVKVVLKVIWQNQELELDLPDKSTVQDLLVALQNEPQTSNSKVFVVYNGKILKSDSPLSADGAFLVYPSISGG